VIDREGHEAAVKVGLEVKVKKGLGLVGLEMGKVRDRGLDRELVVVEASVLTGRSDRKVTERSELQIGTTGITRGPPAVYKTVGGLFLF